MTIETADRIIGFLEKYNGVYRDMVAFLTEKQAKVMADDLLWLLDSVEDEQAGYEDTVGRIRKVGSFRRAWTR